jgi:hypothetical protein
MRFSCNTLRTAAIAIGVVGFMGSACLAEDNTPPAQLDSATTGSPSSAISLDAAVPADGSAQADISAVDGVSVDTSDTGGEPGRVSE